MLATRSWVYLDLEKSGSTFMRNILQSLFPLDEFTETKKHRLMKTEPCVPKLMTIRDPHEYYFSLWSYGLQKKGGFYNRVSTETPLLSDKMYEEDRLECYIAFLDYALHSPVRYPSRGRYGWLPLGLDLYSARILSMIIPVSCREQFLERLMNEYPSPERIISAISDFIPDILIRTSNLSADFHRLASYGRLDFLKLPVHWQVSFPINAPKINASTQSQSSKKVRPGHSVGSALPSSWKKAIEKKSKLALWMMERAARQVEAETNF